MRGIVVAVVGPGQPDDPALLATAREIGAGLAAAGCTVVTGGLGGVMAAASQGAREAGGFVVGILPGEDATAPSSPSAAGRCSDPKPMTTSSGSTMPTRLFR